MPVPPTLLHDSVLTASVSALLYTATVTTTALVALLTRNPQRRRAAWKVLSLLLRRPPR